jgi:integrase/recombinase XerD
VPTLAAAAAAASAAEAVAAAVGFRDTPTRHRRAAILDAARAERGAATNTALAYGRDLLDFAAWATRQGCDFASAGREDIHSYLIFCEAAGLGQSTRARRLSAIKQMYRFAFEEGWRSENPALRIKGPGARQSLPKTLSEEDVNLIGRAFRKVWGQLDSLK